jgi:O-antigen ligase
MDNMNSQAELVPAERLALAAIAAMLTVPFLLPFHGPPIQTFYQEWLAGALGCAAFLLLAISTPGQRITIPALALLPLGLIAILVAHGLSGRLVYLEQGILGGLYLAWAGLMMAVGFRLRERLGSERFAACLAWPILLGAMGSAAIGLLQYLDWTSSNWILPAINQRAHGNLAQPNHFANYLSLGLVSAIFLASSGRLSRLAAGGAMLLMLIAVSFSGSRAVVLYLAFAFVGALLLRWRSANPELRRAAWWVTACLVVFFLVQMLVAIPGEVSSVPADTIASRTMEQGASIDTRLRKWHAALLMAVEHPWIGVGFKGYAWHHFTLAPRLAAEQEGLASDNAHNLFFQVIAEFGFVAAVLLSVVAIAWLLAQRRRGASLGIAWLWAVVGVLLIHSGLEYPLWYTYFLGVLALLAGGSWHRPWSLALARAGRVVTLGVCCVSAVSLAMLWVDYRGLDRLSNAPQRAELQPEWQSRVVTAYRDSMFPHVLVSSLARSARVDTEGLDAKIALNTKALRLFPTPEAAYRQALFLSLRGDRAGAEQAWDQAFAAYPRRAAGVIKELEADAQGRFGVLLEYARSKTGTSN